MNESLVLAAMKDNDPKGEVIRKVDDHSNTYRMPIRMNKIAPTRRLDGVWGLTHSYLSEKSYREEVCEE